MTRAVVVGAGMTRFGKHLGAAIGPLGAVAAAAALESAGLGVRDVQAATCGNVLGGMLPGQRILHRHWIVVGILAVGSAIRGRSAKLFQAPGRIGQSFELRDLVRL